MSMLKDPDMEEIVVGFCDESDELAEQLEQILEEYEDDFAQTELLERYGQIIDRIMGAAKSIEANTIGHYCELGKIISYKASQTNDKELLTIVCAVLFDTLEVVQAMLESVRKTKEEKVAGINLEKLATRLKWLSEKFTHIERASVAVNSPNEGQDSIDDLLEKLGI